MSSLWCESKEWHKMAEVERLLYNCEEIGIIKGTNQGEGRAAAWELSVEKHHRSLRIKGACHRISFEARVPGLPDKNSVPNITIYTHLDTYNLFPSWTKSNRLNLIDAIAHGLDHTQDKLTIPLEVLNFNFMYYTLNYNFIRPDNATSTSAGQMTTDLVNFANLLLFLSGDWFYFNLSSTASTTYCN